MYAFCTSEKQALWIVFGIWYFPNSVFFDLIEAKNVS